MVELHAMTWFTQPKIACFWRYTHQFPTFNCATHETLHQTTYATTSSFIPTLPLMLFLKTSPCKPCIGNSISSSTVPLQKSHWSPTDEQVLAYDSPNWRHSDLHGWTWRGRGAGQEGSRHRLLEGWVCAKAHGGDVLFDVTSYTTRINTEQEMRRLIRPHQTQ